MWTSWLRGLRPAYRSARRYAAWVLRSTATRSPMRDAGNRPHESATALIGTAPVRRPDMACFGDEGRSRSVSAGARRAAASDTRAQPARPSVMDRGYRVGKAVQPPNYRVGHRIARGSKRLAGALARERWSSRARGCSAPAEMTASHADATAIRAATKSSATTRQAAAAALPDLTWRKREIDRTRSASGRWRVPWPSLPRASANALLLLGPLGPGNDPQIRSRPLVEHGEVLQQVTVRITKVHGGGRHPADHRRLVGLLAEE